MKTISVISKGLLVAVLAVNTVACNSHPQVEEEMGGDEAKIQALLTLEPEVYYSPINGCSVVPTVRDEAAIALANRVVTMYGAIDYSYADSVWLWAEATERVVKQYAEDYGMPRDTAILDLHRALENYGYDAYTQFTMNRNAEYLTVIQTFDVAFRYRQLMDKIEDPQLLSLIRAEFNAWFEWMDAEYFTNVYYTHGADRYSALPLDFWCFHKYYTENRLAMLDVEEGILLNNKRYSQRGKTVTSQQWHDWLSEQGYREGMSPEFNVDDPLNTDFPALIKDKTERWLAARQTVSGYLGNATDKGKSYDYLTADIHASIMDDELRVAN